MSFVYHPAMSRASIRRFFLVALVLASCDGATTADAGVDAATPDAGAPPAEVMVDIAEGPVVGLLDQGVHTFWNIPYAESPEGDARWRPPVPRASWTEPHDGTARGVRCAQSGLADFAGVEDCLRLNVWTPELAPESPLPVMVWIHGGAFAVGSGSDSLYDAQNIIAARPVVVVSINYRLGELGYLAHPALSAEGGGTSGNYGLLDQIEALRWVQRNVGRFGGDVDNVTVFGESAGGHSVCQLVASPTSRGLFHRAISQSGICSLPMFTLAEAEPRGETFAASVGCDGADPLTCLRALPPEALQVRLDPSALPGGLFYQRSIPIFPIADGTHLPDSLDALMRAGAHDTSVPVIVGSNTDEAELFQGPFLSTQVADEAEYREALGRFWSATSADAIVAEYPVADYDSANDALTVATTDGFFICPARRTTRALADAGNPTWQYVFAGLPQGSPFPGSFHSAELTFLFGNSSTLGSAGARGAGISGAMQGYWTRFAETGDPNGDGAFAWPAYDSIGDEHLRIDLEIIPGTAHLAAKCDFWDGILDAF